MGTYRLARVKLWFACQSLIEIDFELYIFKIP